MAIPVLMGLRLGKLSTVPKWMMVGSIKFKLLKQHPVDWGPRFLEDWIGAWNEA